MCPKHSLLNNFCASHITLATFKANGDPGAEKLSTELQPLNAQIKTQLQAERITVRRKQAECKDMVQGKCCLRAELIV